MTDPRPSEPRSHARTKSRIAGLMGGLPIDRFNEEVRERRWTHYPSAFTGIDVTGMFYTADQLEADIVSNTIRAELIDIFVNGQLVRFADLHHKTGRSHLAVLIDQIRQRSMVRIRDLQNASPQVADTARQIEQLFLARCQVNLYLAPAGGAGFPAHFDISDAFIVQCGGAKQWTIHEDYVDRIALPTADTPWEPERYKPSGAGHSLVLHQGDVLYLPRGVMHSARCTDQHSLHLTVSMESLTYADVLLSEVQRLAHEIPELRSRIPWSWDGQDAALTEALRERMRMLAGGVEAGPSLQEARRVLGRSHGIPSGMLSDVLTRAEGSIS